MRPRAGTTLRAAIGTTFTLDLVTALSVPLAFSARDLGDTPDSIGVMEAIRGAADRVDVFYQVGHAQVPRQESDILAFLEPTLHPVRAPRAGHLFHPKVWVLSFEDELTVSYRLIVSSRNLTSERCWDVVVAVDGTAGRKRYSGNRPLSDFVRALPDLVVRDFSPPRRERLHTVADELMLVEWEWPQDALELNFHALGVPTPKTALDFTGRRHLVVSPFVEDAGLAHVAPAGSTNVVLVARSEHIDRLQQVPVNTNLRVMSAMAELEEERAEGELSGLHAKLTVVERGWNTHLFAGSANATHAAYNGNVEFVLELVRRTSKYGIDTYLDPQNGMGALLEEYEQQPPLADADEDRRWKLEALMRALAELDWAVTVSGIDPYALDISTSQHLPKAAESLGVELLTRRGEALHPRAGEPASERLSGVPLADITAFLVLTLRDGELVVTSVVPAALVNEPAERLDAVLARQVDTPEKFLRFLMLLLGLLSPGSEVGGSSGGAGTWQTFGGGGEGVFEVVARALADHPSRLDDLGRIVERLAATDKGQQILPPGFLELWALVDEARGLIASAK
jgi:hypothetical protein